MAEDAPVSFAAGDPFAIEFFQQRHHDPPGCIQRLPQLGNGCGSSRADVILNQFNRPQIVLARENQEQLLAAVERLSDDHRDAIACRFFLDLTEDETAAALRVRRGTVKSRLSRALERLREELEGEL